MSLTARIVTAISATLAAALDFGTVSAKVKPADIVQTYSTGTGNGQANALFSDQRELTASQAESLDLAGTRKADPGSLQAAFALALELSQRARRRASHW